MEGFRKFFRITEFVAQEALTSMSRSAFMSWIVIMTMAVSLSILGGAWMVVDDLQNLASHVGSRLEIMVFLRDDASPVGVEKAIRELPGVAAVQMVPRDKAWEEFQTDMRAKLTFDNLLENNPLPNSAKVKMVDAADIAATAERIGKMPGVEEVSYGRDLLNKLQEMTAFLQFAGLGISGILGIASLAVVMNTIRLAVMTRKREIEIMHLVGASNSFIQWPFLLEGMLFGLFSAALTGFVLVGWRIYSFGKLQELFQFVPLEFNYLSTIQTLTWLLLIGMGMGALGSLLSVKRYLKSASVEA